MERTDSQGMCRFLPNKFFEPFVHFAGSFVGERHGENVEGGYAHFLDKVSDTIGKDTGFAAARTGEDKHRTIGVFDGFLL
jgi:hypothetical protein